MTRMSQTEGMILNSPFLFAKCIFNFCKRKKNTLKEKEKPFRVTVGLWQPRLPLTVKR